MVTNANNLWNQLFGGGTSSSTNPSTVVAAGTSNGTQPLQSVGQQILTAQQLQKLYDQYNIQMQQTLTNKHAWFLGQSNMPGEWRHAYIPSLLQTVMAERVEPMDRNMFLSTARQNRMNESLPNSGVESFIIKRMILSEEPLYIERELYMHVWIANLKKGI